MATKNQSAKLSFHRIRRNRRPKFFGSPQRRGVVRRLRICTPRKPNSARRPVVKIKLSSKKWALSHIPGQGHNLRRFSKVLIGGVGARDLPTVNYTCIRGVLDFAPAWLKKRRRSIYGVKRDPLTVTHITRKVRRLGY